MLNRKDRDALESYRKLLHKVFRQTEEGKAILQWWEEDLKMSPGDLKGQDLYNLGVVAGHKEFVRNIIHLMSQAEGKS